MTTRSEIAYETAEKSLADQRQSVTDLRGRVATLLSAAAIVASFLGAQALSGSPTTATTSTTTATTTATTPETRTETTHGSTTGTSPESATQTTHGTVTETTRGTATSTTHGTRMTRPTKTASAGIHLNTWGWLALGSFVLLAILCVVILLPWEWSGWHTNAKVLVRDYVDPSDKTVESMARDLALYDERYYDANKGKLNILYWCFRIASGLLVAQVVLWIVDLEAR